MCPTQKVQIKRKSKRDNKFHRSTNQRYRVFQWLKEQWQTPKQLSAEDFDTNLLINNGYPR